MTKSRSKKSEDPTSDQTGAPCSPEPRNTGGEPHSLTVWDRPVRFFHWFVVLFVVVSVYTGKTGGLTQMDIHKLSGYGILTMVLFRLAWGFVGSPRARFSQFVRGGTSVLEYSLDFVKGRPARYLGHNPLGGWSIVAMLAVLLGQATTGLFANDDIFTEGPLATMVEKSTSDWLTGVHGFLGVVLLVLIAVHVAAVALYWIKGENLIVPMITGRKRAGAAVDRDELPLTSSSRAAAIFLGAVAIVVVLVNI